jgi:tartrate dehydrogenase/decarboxylase/D-malate dehydrogenase
MSQTFKIAAIPGDGIGKEVMPEGLRVLDAAARRFDIDLQITPIDWASCDHYAKTGAMMPADWKAQLQGLDAIYFGAVGWPAAVPDHISLWGSLLKFRREFDQYVNLRPVRLFEGVPCPLVDAKGKPRKPGDIDFFVVRENTEGEYTNLGGRLYEGTEREIVIQESVFSRHGTDRVMKYAFELAQSRPRKHLTVATKSNGIAISMPWWDERADAMAKGYPSVTVDKQHIDILSARFVLQPTRFDVVVASNLFGDILSDLGPACTGDDRPRAVGQPEPGSQIPVAVRAGARLGPRHLRPEHRQPGGDDLVGRADARFPRLPRCPRCDRRRDRTGAGRRPAHRRSRRRGLDDRGRHGDRAAGRERLRGSNAAPSVVRGMHPSDVGIQERNFLKVGGNPRIGATVANPLRLPTQGVLSCPMPS